MAKDIFSSNDMSKFGKERKSVKIKRSLAERIRERNMEKNALRRFTKQKEHTHFKPAKRIRLPKPNIKVLLTLLVIILLCFGIYALLFSKTQEEKAGAAAVKLADQEITKLIGTDDLKAAIAKGYSGAKATSVVLEGDKYNVNIAFTINRLDLNKNIHVPSKYSANIIVDSETFEASIPDKWI